MHVRGWRWRRRTNDALARPWTALETKKESCHWHAARGASTAFQAVPPEGTALSHARFAGSIGQFDAVRWYDRSFDPSDSPTGGGGGLGFACRRCGGGGGQLASWRDRGVDGSPLRESATARRGVQTGNAPARSHADSPAPKAFF